MMTRVLNKLTKISNFTLFFLPALVVNIMIRIIRPLILIRFGGLRSDVIGNSSLYVEYYLSERELNNDKSLDFFFFDHAVPNSQWALMVRRQMYVYPIIRYFSMVNKMFPNHGIYTIETALYDRSSKYMFKTILRTKKPHICFTEKENIKGFDFLKKIGLKSDEKFVCLLVRDSSYKEECQQQLNNNNWSYHNYRNSDINDYTDMALYLVKRGYTVIRMGKGKHKAFHVKHPKIIDYPNSLFRNDFLDIWLTANCFFMVSTGTGLDTIALIFRRPTAFLNLLPLGGFNSQWNVLVVPKHLSWKDNGKKLTLREHLKHKYYRSDEYATSNIQISNLTPREIKDLVMEMDLRLSGVWKATSEDVELQNLFIAQLKNWKEFQYEHAGNISTNARAGAFFLRNNKEWLNYYE